MFAATRGKTRERERGREREREGERGREREREGGREGFYVLDTLLYLHNSSAYISRYSSNYKVLKVNIMSNFKLGGEGKRERDGEEGTRGG